MLFRSTGQRGIAGRQKLQLVQIGASQTERTLFFFEGNPSLPPKTFLTLVTLRVAVGDEDFDFFFFWLCSGSHILRVSHRLDAFNRCMVNRYLSAQEANYTGAIQSVPSASADGIIAQLV